MHTPILEAATFTSAIRRKDQRCTHCPRSGGHVAAGDVAVDDVLRHRIPKIVGIDRPSQRVAFQMRPLRTPPAGVAGLSSFGQTIAGDGSRRVPLTFERNLSEELTFGEATFRQKRQKVLAHLNMRAGPVQTGGPPESFPLFGGKPPLFTVSKSAKSSTWRPCLHRQRPLWQFLI